MPRVRKNGRTPKTKAMVSSRGPTINTRILRALSSRSETKRYISDSNLLTGFSAQTAFYINPVAGINVGAGPNQRIGDKIQIVGVDLSVTFVPNGNISESGICTGRMVKQSNNTSYGAISLAPYTGAQLQYAGFPSTGIPNKEAYTFYGTKTMNIINEDRSSWHQAAWEEGIPSGAFTAGPIFTQQTRGDFNNMKHYVKMNKVVHFQAGGQVLKDGSYQYVINIDHPAAAPGGADHGRLYCAYVVYYKDI